MRCLPHSNRESTHGPVEDADGWCCIVAAAEWPFVSWGGPSMGQMVAGRKEV